MRHDPDTAPALGEVPWPEQSLHDLEMLALCCPECGNNELVETSIITDQGRETALECDHCGEVCPDVR
ncbi:hypothetical protein [Planomonospora venezuelensis]|uniref:Putative RNA-binding Zn-ribbon protein involved in translation (DUF1610 family) n=1 Tax=Planomonospora venezuelensis TaxID=1999 RepID=A0A841DHU4_PLAVE|nr:hypothetical protein [Planomonospora venezuelensis]MBB5967878.1 putative RNA-binding Zn-ribbon protein involved in translation (DUF1610 family) [Planomonospora venezuelensis]GIN03278.1 hypothetical protein Pve01_49360 [Planomonospora venezuelensis]